MNHRNTPRSDQSCCDGLSLLRDLTAVRLRALVETTSESVPMNPATRARMETLRSFLKEIDTIKAGTTC